MYYKEADFGGLDLVSYHSINEKRWSIPNRLKAVIVSNHDMIRHEF